MRKLIIILFFAGLASHAVKAQFLDSLQASLNRKGNFSLIFNSRNTSIGPSSAFIEAVMIGVRFDRKIGLGGGINFLAPALQDQITIESVNYPRYLSFSYISYYIEYLLKINKHWLIDMFLIPGIGSSEYQYTYKGKLITEDNQMVIPIEPSACLEYDFNKFIGVYVQAGYRYMLVKNTAINVNFNAPTYAVGVAIYPLELFAALFPKTKLAHIIEDN